MNTTTCQKLSKNNDSLDESAATNDLNEPNLKGDWINIFILLLLYIMHNFPLGLCSAITILMQSRKDTFFQDQAIFFVTMWPYCLKLLWAPLVDAVYIRRIGRRKSWLIPIHYILAFLFLYMANNINKWLPEIGKPKIMTLTVVFFVSNFLSATQEIVVDGWVLTMLKNSIGQAIGLILGSVFPILFTSDQFCNKYIRTEPAAGGIITLESFLYFWAIAFVFIITLIAIFKKEKDFTLENDYIKFNVFQNYILLWEILKLPSIRILAVILITARIGFAATDNVYLLKLIDVGVPKDDIAIINIGMLVVKIIIPLLISKHISGSRPMDAYLKGTPTRLLWNLIFILLIYYTPQIIFVNGTVNVPMYYYIILVFILLIYRIFNYIMHVTLLSFFSRISDPRFGSTYMTFLSTLSNFGYTWTSTLALEMIDILTFKECSNDSQNNCSTLNLKNTCEANGGNCKVIVNGYYVEILLCMILGFVWYGLFKNIIVNLQSKIPSYWMVNLRQSETKNIEKSYTMAVT